jgi:hypothetical protein
MFQGLDNFNEGEEMRRSGRVAIGFLATVAIGACNDRNAQSAQVPQDCVDNRTNQVVSRDYCNPGHASYLPYYVWYYGGTSYRNGAGMYVRGGSYSRANVSKSYASPSRSVSRGVVGSRGSASS